MEQFHSELELSGKENEANLVKGMQQKLQTKFQLRSPKEAEKLRVEKQKEEKRILSKRRLISIVFAIAFFASVVLLNYIMHGEFKVQYIYGTFIMLLPFVFVIYLLLYIIYYGVKGIVYLIRRR